MLSQSLRRLESHKYLPAIQFYICVHYLLLPNKPLYKLAILFSHSSVSQQFGLGSAGHFSWSLLRSLMRLKSSPGCNRVWVAQKQQERVPKSGREGGSCTYNALRASACSTFADVPLGKANQVGKTRIGAGEDCPWVWRDGGTIYLELVVLQTTPLFLKCTTQVLVNSKMAYWHIWPWLTWFIPWALLPFISLFVPA